jgi:hypothetical protein
MAQTAFRHLMRTAIAPTLRAHDFTGSGQTYHRRQGSNWGVFNVQKSVASTAAYVFFTINVGVWSERVATAVTPAHRPRRPSVWDCHWQERVGHLLPEKRDVWWTLDSEMESSRLSDYLRQITSEHAIPAILAHTSDEALRDLWLSEVSHGLTNYRRLQNLLVLLKALGPSDHLPLVLDAWRQVAGSRAVEYERQLGLEA